MTIAIAAIAVFAAGFVLGLWVSREWISIPLWETEAALREELRTARIELATHEFRDWQKDCRLFQDGWTDALGYATAPWEFVEKHSVAHFDLTEPKIERREHSDVFFIQVEDLLR